jgi:hypothetical protein
MREADEPSTRKKLNRPYIDAVRPVPPEALMLALPESLARLPTA